MDDIKENLKSKILAMFWKYGIKSVTLDDISQHLSISKKTLYKYFKDKSDIVYETTLLHFKAEKELMISLEKTSQNPVDHLYQVSNCMRSYSKQINPAAIFDIRKHYPKSWELMLEHKELVIAKQFERNLSEGIEQGYYRSDININIMTQLKLAEFDLVFDSHSFQIEDLNPIEISIELFDHFLRGIFTPKGLETYINYTSKENN